MAAGALGCSISGAGPDHVRLVRWRPGAGACARPWCGVPARTSWRATIGSSAIESPGARVVTTDAVREHPRRARTPVGFRRGADAGARAGRRPVRAERSWPSSARSAGRAGDALCSAAGGAAAGAVRRRRALAARAAGDPARGVQLSRRRWWSLDARSALGVLELFHGPTAAFKDFGARFLAAALARLRRRERPLKILVATSGDTGGAVAAAFHRRPASRSRCCFPRAWCRRRRSTSSPAGATTCGASPCAAASMTASAWSSRPSSDPRLRAHVRAVLGQQHQSRPAAAADGVLRGRQPRSAARAHGEPASFVIPSGNLATRRPASGRGSSACRSANRAGAQRQPHRAGLLRAGVLRAAAERRDAGLGDGRRQSEQPGAAARACFPTLRALRLAVSAVSIDDAAIRARIRAGYERTGRSGARTPRRRPRPVRGCRRRGRPAAGCWWRRRIRRSSARSSSR